MGFFPAQTLAELALSGTTKAIPTGATGVKIIAQGAGGAGGTPDGGGGGGGGEAVKSYDVLEAEWGTNLTIAVGQGATAANGGATTVDGTLNGSAITQLKGFGGNRGIASVQGTGGSASGGTTNTAGADGQLGLPGEPGLGGDPPRADDDSVLLQAENATPTGLGGAGRISGASFRGKHGGILFIWSF